ncbi:c-type cytochrome [Roseovarius sp. SYSU LYC5161]|uniref:c-type cytochrome n=1 Tax=Roseovarius halophilus (ex Wu et al. 2025) TaxID=3376060 RepID=UPI00399AE664
MRVLRPALLVIGALVAGAAPAQQFTSLKGHGGPVMGISVNSTTGQVATASFDNSVGLWRDRHRRWLEGHDAAVNTVLFASDGLVASGGDDFDIILWRPDAGTRKRLEGHEGKVERLALAPDGTLLASASWDGTVGLWPLDGGPPRFMRAHDGAVNDVTFSGDGRALYSASADGTIRRWDPATGADRLVLDQGFGVNRLVIGTEGAWLAYGAVDGVTRVVDPENGDILHDFSLERRPILSMAHHPGAGLLAVGDGHGYIMIVDTENWKIARDFRAMRQGPVWAVEFSADGRMIYAGGIENVAFGWPVAMLDAFDPAGGEPRSFLRDPEEMSNGERQFMRKCSICHALSPPPSRKAGPSLHDLFGRPAGSVPGYSYSEVLKGADIVWSDETIDALFELGPDHYIPGSKMPMQRIAAEKDRRDLIDFLRNAAVSKENEE